MHTIKKVIIMIIPIQFATNAAAIANCTNSEISGIKITNSQMCKLTCNKTEKLGTCIAFSGNCQSPGQGFYGNTMTSGKYGLRFMNNAIIGSQNGLLSAIESSNNTWGAVANFPTALTGRQTYSENLTLVSNVNTASPLRLNNIPTLNGNIPFATAYNSTGLISSTLNQNDCSVIPPNGPALASASTSAAPTGMNAAIQPAVSNTGITDNNTKTLNKMAAFNLMTDIPSLQSASASNTSFYNTNTSTCIGKMRTVQNQLRAGNFNLAKTTNNSFTANCDAETHTKNYYDLYIKWMTDTLCCDSIFKTNVLAIANACPEKHGVVVNKARALYNVITKSNTIFTDGCNAGGGSRIIQTNPEIENDKTETISNRNTESISIAPNPNNGQFEVLFASNFSGKVNVNITDASQKKVYTATEEVKDGKLSITLSLLKSGVYFAQLHDNIGLNKSIKFVIVSNE
jgi:Secretion system C-terminal sorting domain